MARTKVVIGICAIVVALLPSAAFAADHKQEPGAIVQIDNHRTPVGISGAEECMPENLDLFESGYQFIHESVFKNQSGIYMTSFVMRSVDANGNAAPMIGRTVDGRTFKVTFESYSIQDSRYSSAFVDSWMRVEGEGLEFYKTFSSFTHPDRNGQMNAFGPGEVVRRCDYHPSPAQMGD